MFYQLLLAQSTDGDASSLPGNLENIDQDAIRQIVRENPELLSLGPEDLARLASDEELLSKAAAEIENGELSDETANEIREQAGLDEKDEDSDDEEEDDEADADSSATILAITGLGAFVLQ